MLVPFPMCGVLIGDVMVVETLITSVCSLCGSLVAVYFSNRKNNAIIEYKIKQLEETVNKHNMFAEDIGEIAKHNAVVDEKKSVINHRLSDLEGANGV